MRFLATLMLAGCTAQDPGASFGHVQFVDGVDKPFIIWDVYTNAGHYSGQSESGANAPWVVPPEYGDVYGLTFNIEGVVGFRLDAPRRLVPGTLDLADPAQVALWTATCYEWQGTVMVFRDLPHWALNISASCNQNPLYISGYFEGWID